MRRGLPISCHAHAPNLTRDSPQSFRASITGPLRHVIAVISLAFVFLSATPLHATPPASGPASDFIQALVNFEPYAESIWHDDSSKLTDSGYFGDGVTTGNGGIRGSTAIAVVYAVLIREYPNSPNKTNRLNRVRQALRYAAQTHTTGTTNAVDGLKWGHGWQTNMWAGALGFACVLVQDQLPADVISDCQRVLADESNYRAGIVPLSGYVGDTQGESNAWDTNAPALAAAWMPTNANASLWLTTARKYLVNSYTVPDTTGDPLASWVTTQTLYPSYSMENHGFYHPGYQSVTGMSLSDSWLMAYSASPAVAEQLRPYAEHNMVNVWNQFSKINLDSGDIMFPCGQDWALHDFGQISHVVWMSAHHGLPQARWIEEKLSKLILARQAQNGNGTFVGVSGGGFYREAVCAVRIADAYLQEQSHGFYNPGTTPLANHTTHWTDVKIISQRADAGLVTVSYGARIMATISPPAGSSTALAFVTTPRLPGIIATGPLGDATAATLVGYTQTPSGFAAEFLFTHGSNGTSRVKVVSTGDAVAFAVTPQPAAGISASTNPEFPVGIENDPLTGGTRTLAWSGGSQSFTNLAGSSRSGISSPWVCVDNRLGVVAGAQSSGTFKYQSAAGYTRTPASINEAGAAEDTLSYAPSSVWQPRYAIMLPGATTAQTAAVSSATTWTPGTAGNSLDTRSPSGIPIHIDLVSAPVVAATIPVTGVTASASSSQSGYPPSNAVDGSTTDFWVSSGSLSGQGPTASHPETLSFAFPQSTLVHQVYVVPRNSYGPKTLKCYIGSQLVFDGSMANSTPLTISISPPVAATSASLVFTDSYDPTYPSTPRNVQVAEVTFYRLGINGFNLQNVTTNTAIGAFGDSSTLNLATIGVPVTVAAVPSATAPSVKFGYDANASQQIENTSPYFLSGKSSGNPVAWTPAVGNHTLTATAYSGGNASGSASAPQSIGFRAIRLSQPWQLTDIGTSPALSWTDQQNTSITLASYAQGPASTDSYSFVNTTGTGDLIAITCLSSLTSQNPQASAGIQLRASQSNIDAFVCLARSTSGTLTLKRRASSGTSPESISLASPAAGTSPVWLELMRQGNTITALTSTDHHIWTTQASLTQTLPSTVLVGPSASQNSSTGNCSAVFPETQILPASLTSFGDWQAARFSQSEAANPAIGAASADPDADTIPNLLEYVSGNDPWKADASAYTASLASDHNHLNLTFKERASLQNITRTFETSSDLFTWTTTTPATLTNNGDGTWTAGFPGNGRTFVRIRYVLNSP